MSLIWISILTVLIWFSHSIHRIFLICWRPLKEIWSQSGELNSKLEKDKQKEIEKENEKLKDENRQLKEEYEKFKIRTNYLIKTAKLNKVTKLFLPIKCNKLVYKLIPKDDIE